MAVRAPGITTGSQGAVSFAATNAGMTTAILVVLLVVVVVVLLLLFSASFPVRAETYKNATHRMESTGHVPEYNIPEYNVNSEVYIRRDGRGCYTKAKIVSRPSNSNQYYVVQYRRPSDSLYNEASYQEHVHRDEFYGGIDESTRAQKRVFPVDVTTPSPMSGKAIPPPLQNPYKLYVSEEQKRGGSSSRLLCDQGTGTTPDPALLRSPSGAKSAQMHMAQIRKTMNLIWDNTYVNVHFRYVNSGPSPLSDVHTTTGRPPTAPFDADSPDLYYTSNGCRPHKNDYRLAVHPEACNYRYKFDNPVPVEMHLLGSDDSGGSLLCVFQQLISNLNVTLIQLVGRDYAEHMLRLVSDVHLSIEQHRAYRQRVSHQLLHQTFGHVHGDFAEKSLSSLDSRTLMTRQNILVQRFSVGNGNGNGNGDGPGNGDDANHKKPYNRLLLLPLIRNPAHGTPSGSLHQKTSRANAYLCDHDGVVSIGKDSMDITAEVSFAAKQSTATSRFAYRPRFRQEDMRANTVRDIRNEAKDRYFLSLWLFIFGVRAVPNMLLVFHKKSIEAHKAASAVRHITNTTLQLLSLLSSTPVAQLRSEPALLNWSGALLHMQKAPSAAKTTSARHFFGVLLDKHANDTMGHARKSEWQHELVVGTSSRNAKTVQLQVPWNKLVFGESILPSATSLGKYKITTHANPASMSTTNVTVRSLRTDREGWKHMLVLQMSKRIQLLLAHPHRVFDQILFGPHFTMDHPPEQQLHMSPLFADFSDNPRLSYDGMYTHKRKYTNPRQPTKCHIVLCDAAQSKLVASQSEAHQRVPSITPGTCCVDDRGSHSSCLDQFQEATCRGPHRPVTALKGVGGCHTSNPDARTCDRVFSEMIHNCRNGLLVIEPESETSGLARFWEYLTHPTDARRRIRMLNRMVKTMVLCVDEFGQDVFCDSSKGSHKLDVMGRALSLLCEYYFIVGLHAPAISSMNGLRDTDKELHSSQFDTGEDRGSEKALPAMYNSMSTVNITFRRKYENSRNVLMDFHAEKFSTYRKKANTEIRRAAKREANLSGYNSRYYERRLQKLRSHHVHEAFMRENLTHYMHPAMLHTVVCMSWFDANLEV